MKRTTIIIFLIGILAFQVSTVYTQDAVTAGDSTSLDFWVGSWSLSWKENDTSVAYGENTVTKIMDGKVVQENFVAHTGVSAGFKGTSVSVFDRADGKWRQTWVDNQSVYLEFTGGVRGENRFFERSFTRERPQNRQESRKSSKVFFF